VITDFTPVDDNKLVGVSDDGIVQFFRFSFDGGYPLGYLHLPVKTQLEQIVCISYVKK
jgi:hypothetical protein